MRISPPETPDGCDLRPQPELARIFKKKNGIKGINFSLLRYRKSLVHETAIARITDREQEAAVVAPDDFRDAMRLYERRHILEVLQKNGFNKEQAAKALNIGLSSLYRKIDELDIGAGDLKGA